PPEGLAVDDAVAVALKRGAQPAVGLGMGALGGVGARGQRGEISLLPRTDALGEPVGDRSGRVLVARCHGLLVHTPILTAPRAARPCALRSPPKAVRPPTAGAGGHARGGRR